MSGYDKSIDHNIEEHYKKEIDLLREIDHPYGSYNTFWIWIAELLTECFNPNREIVGINDFMGMIMDKIKGNNSDCNRILFIVDRSESEYERYLDHYRIDAKIENCGEYYQELFRRNDRAIINKAVEIFIDYTHIVAPYTLREVEKMAAIIMSEKYDEKELLEVKKRYKKYIAKYKGIIKYFKQNDSQ